MAARAAEAERQARLDAEESNRVKDEFLAMLSHELRNPLSSILGWAMVLRKGQVSQEQVSHALEVIERNVRVEAELVESLLDLSRIAAGKLELDKQRVDLSSLLETVNDSLRPAADTKGLRLEVLLPPEPIVITGDSGRVQQIFSNLLTNAIKFTAPGGEVQVLMRCIGSQAEIRVADSGEGIHPDFLPHVFDRFRQGESAKSRKHGGLGLGLAIVRELVHAHSGTITVDSEGKGKGATFTVVLPIPAILPMEIEPANLDLRKIHDGSAEGLRILIVDDDADARELISLTFKSAGAAVQSVSSAAEAFKSLKGAKADVLIADIGMPHEDGYVLMEKLRRLERERSDIRLPAIALTAYASISDRDHALASGYDLHLTKPVAPSDLLRSTAELVRKFEDDTAKAPAR
jgi:CheY-like chemotaxis protein